MFLMILIQLPDAKFIDQVITVIEGIALADEAGELIKFSAFPAEGKLGQEETL